MPTIKYGNGPAVEILPEAASESRFVYHEVFQDKVYSRHGVTIQDGNCIIDVGANVGMFSMFAMQQAKDLRIFAFEPVPPIHELLSRNVAQLKESGQHEISINPFGLSGEKTTLEITYFPNAPANSTCYLEDKQEESDVVAQDMSFSHLWKYNKLSAIFLAVLPPFIRKRLISSQLRKLANNFETFEAQFLTLDEVIDKNQIGQIDLLKIDVEGSEFDVLAGLSDENLSRVKQLVIEISPANHEKIEPLKEKLLGNGFNKIELETMGYDKFIPDARTTCSMYAIH